MLPPTVVSLILTISQELSRTYFCPGSVLVLTPMPIRFTGWQALFGASKVDPHMILPVGPHTASAASKYLRLSVFLMSGRKPVLDPSRANVSQVQSVSNALNAPLAPTS